MGKRRVRCLQALGQTDIIGFDLRADRREEAQRLYNIETVAVVDDIPFKSVDAFIVSTPPDRHEPFLRMAVQHGKPAFVEASVILGGLESVDEESIDKNILIAPSCTLRFHPAIKEIKRIVDGGKYGRVVNFSYHTGQYLPDWHPWENVKDFYVSQKETGGGREIVPFEFTWLNDVFGVPSAAQCFFGKTRDVGADIDDTYAISLKYPNSFGTVMVDVVSRYAVRHLIVNLTEGAIVWTWDSPEIRVFDAKTQAWESIRQQKQAAHAGYNPNIIEGMYQEELGCFIAASQKRARFPNTLSDDINVLKLLHSLEETHADKK
jgi:predicted dehydrogenase